jgi:hypothetical protein
LVIPIIFSIFATEKRKCIMTLDEAIQHCKEKAEQHPCDECGRDHEQLGKWLEELREYRMRELNIN